MRRGSSRPCDAIVRYWHAGTNHPTAIHRPCAAIQMTQARAARPLGTTISSRAGMDMIVAKVPLPTYRFTIKPDDLGVWIDVLKDLGQLSVPIDKAKIVVTAP